MPFQLLLMCKTSTLLLQSQDFIVFAELQPLQAAGSDVSKHSPDLFLNASISMLHVTGSNLSHIWLGQFGKIAVMCALQLVSVRFVSCESGEVRSISIYMLNYFHHHFCFLDDFILLFLVLALILLLYLHCFHH